MNDITIAWGQRADFTALERFHYRAGPPATIAPRPDGGAGVLAARAGDTLAGVLVVSMPTLNGAWRELAWPGRYDARSLGKREAARQINTELRCISRVIVEPRFRGRGVAASLVRAYLREPFTPATEAIAAMGWLCPFFASAGMTAYRPGLSARDTRLLDALAAVRAQPHDLVDRAHAEAVLRRAPWLARELRRWARTSPTTKARAEGADPLSLAMAAGTAAGARVTAYAAVHHERRTSSQGDGLMAFAPRRDEPPPRTPGPPAPLAPAGRPRADEPVALTFFLGARERSRVLAALRQLHDDRDVALLAALNVRRACRRSGPRKGGA